MAQQVPQFEPATTTLTALNQAFQNEYPGRSPGRAPPPRELSFVSTITGVQDVVKGLAKASIPTRGPRYWQKVTDQDLLLPQDADVWSTLGCIVIMLLLVLAVFK